MTSDVPADNHTTPSATPRGVNPETLFAAVETIDITTRKVTVCDSNLVLHMLVWEPGYLDGKMAKLKISYFRGFVIKPEGEVQRIVTVQWVEKQDIPAWVGQRYKNQGGRGGGGYPRNDKAIILQCCMKVAADVWISSGLKITRGQNLQPPSVNYETAMREITDEAIKAAGELCKAAGVQ